MGSSALQLLTSDLGVRVRMPGSTEGGQKQKLPDCGTALGPQLPREEQGGLLQGYPASEKEPCVVVSSFSLPPLTYGVEPLLTKAKPRKGTP